VTSSLLVLLLSLDESWLCRIQRVDAIGFGLTTAFAVEHNAEATLSRPFVSFLNLWQLEASFPISMEDEFVVFGEDGRLLWFPGLLICWAGELGDFSGNDF
jgi:hypothetical protein